MKKNSGNKSNDAAKKSKAKATPENKLRTPTAPTVPAAKHSKADPSPAVDTTSAAPSKSSKNVEPLTAKKAKVKEAKSSARGVKRSKKAAPVSPATPALTVPSTTVPPPLNRSSGTKLEASPVSIEPPHSKSAHETPKSQTTPQMEPIKAPLSKSSDGKALPKATLTPKAASTKNLSPKPEIKAKPGKRPSRSPEAPRPEVKIPPLLLEGDLPPNPSVSGPGTRYALAPRPVTHAPPSSLELPLELPEAYGTGRVFLAARDPHWLYVSWDFTTEQQAKYNAQSRDRHLIIRVFTPHQPTPAIPEVHVHPESRNWFVHVPFAETSYFAEVGFFDATANWHRAGISSKTLTPPDAPSKDSSAEFATIPADVTFQQVVEAVQQFVAITRNEPLLDAVALAAEAQREGTTAPAPPHQEPAVPQVSKTRIGPTHEVPRQSRPLPPQRAIESLPIQIYPADEWSEEQTLALSRLIHIDSFRRVWMGSMEITELVRRQLEEEVGSIAAADRRRLAFSAEQSGAAEQETISSPVGGELQQSGKFWFKVNAELIIYGATDPLARVTIAERPIKLRPDGTFSFRFSLPDGRYQLPAVAISAEGQEGREARLEFSRSTDYRGHVEAHPQDAALRPPRPDYLE